MKTARILLLLLALATVWAQFRPFDVEDLNPQRRRHIIHPLPLSKFWGPIKQPYPTNSWWLNLVLANGDQSIATYPYLMKMKTSNVCFTLPSFTENKDYVLTTFTDEWCIYLQGNTGHKVTKYDDMTVTVKYPMATGGVTFPMSQGSPFVVAEYEETKPEVVTINAILEITDENGQVYDPSRHPSIPASSKYVIKLNNAHMWVVYFDSKVTLAVTVNSIEVSSKYTGAMKFAVTSSSQMSAALDKHRKTHVVGSDAGYSVSDVTGQVFYRWTVKGDG